MEWLAAKFGLPTIPTLLNTWIGKNLFAVVLRADKAVVQNNGVLRGLLLRKIVAVLAYDATRGIHWVCGPCGKHRRVIFWRCPHTLDWGSDIVRVN